MSTSPEQRGLLPSLSLLWQYRRDIVRLRPHDDATPEGRAAERHRRMFWSATASISSRGIALLTMLITVPLTLEYLGPERYGMWMTISSIISVFAFADLGLGSGLMTEMSHAHGAGDRERARRLVSTAFYQLAAIAGVLAVIVVAGARFVPWTSVYKVHTAAAIAEAQPATMVFLTCNLLMIPFAVAEAVRTGFQSSFSHSLWIAVGNAASLIAVLVAIHFRAGLPWLVATMSGGPLLAVVLSFGFLFVREHPELRPRLNLVSAGVRHDLNRMGGLFIAHNIAVLFLQGCDNFILTQFLGEDAVTRYSIATRLFGIAPTLLVFLTTPLWPAYGEAIARGDATWVRKTLLRSMILVAGIGGAASLVLMFAGRWIISIWVGPAALPSMALVAGLAVWSVQQAAGHALSMLLNAASVIRLQTICAILVSVAALAFKIMMTRTWGIPGVVWGTIAAHLPIVIVPVLVFLPTLLREIQARGVSRRGSSELANASA